LIGASVAIKNQSRGINSNNYGFYSITLPAGSYILICSFVGYESREIQIELNKDLQQDFLLAPRSTLSEVVISSRKRDANVKSAQMGQIDLSINKIKSVPVIFGEVDVLKTLQLLPGFEMPVKVIADCM
jgi:hypothetical protein